MNTIYEIKGGGQRIRETVSRKWNNRVQIIEKDNCDWVEQSKCHGQNGYTHLWASDLESVLEWMYEWASGYAGTDNNVKYVVIKEKELKQDY